MGKKNSWIEPYIEKKCARCGRVFIPAPKHIYKAPGKDGRLKFYCCWTCYNHRKDGAIKKEEPEAIEMTRDELLEAIARISKDENTK